LRERDQGFQAFADDVNVGQAGFVRKDFPGGIKKGGGGIEIRIKIRIRIKIKIKIKIKIRIRIRIGRREMGEPGLDVLLEDFLGFQVLGDDDDGTVGKQR